MKQLRYSVESVRYCHFFNHFPPNARYPVSVKRWKPISASTVTYIREISMK